MKNIDRMIIRSFLGPFIITFLVVTFILLMQFMIRYFDDIVGKGLDFLTIAELFFYFGVSMAPMALPLSVLLSALITYGSLGEHHELTAIKSAGISLIRIIRPVLIFTAFISLSAFFLNNNILPETNLRAFSLIWDIKQKKPSFELEPGVFYQGLPGYSIKIEERGEGNSLKGVLIYDHNSSRGNVKVTTADSGQMYSVFGDRYLVFELYNGADFSELIKANASQYQNTEYVRTEFKRSRIVFDLSSFKFNRTDMSLFKSHRDMRNVSELKQDLDSLDKMKNEIFIGLENGTKQYSFYQFKSDTGKHVTNEYISTIVSKMSPDSMQYQSAVVALNTARNIQIFTRSQLDRFKHFRRERNRFEAEVHRKFTQAVACFVLFLIGAPIGSIVKKGGLGIPILISIVFFILFYMVSVSIEKYSREGIINVSVAMWSPVVAFFFIGLYFMAQARNDSRLFDMDYYRGIIQKLFFRKKTDKS